VLKVIKKLNLEDNKRLWDDEFNQHELQHSKPIKLFYIEVDEFSKHKSYCQVHTS